MFHVPNEYRLKVGMLASTNVIGNNGFFILQHPTDRKLYIKVQASDQMGWEHVSVTLANRKYEGLKRCPTWEEMCYVKSLFWDKEDVVVQYHPAESSYVNTHPYCLHLFRPVGVEMPQPSPLMVGV